MPFRALGPPRGRHPRAAKIVNSIAAMVPNCTATSMAMMPLEVLLSTPVLTCVAWDVLCEMARQSDSSQNLFIG